MSYKPGNLVLNIILGLKLESGFVMCMRIIMINGLTAQIWCIEESAVQTSLQWKLVVWNGWKYRNIYQSKWFYCQRFLYMYLRLLVAFVFLILTSVDTEMCCPKGKCGCQFFILIWDRHNMFEERSPIF